MKLLLEEFIGIPTLSQVNQFPCNIKGYLFVKADILVRSGTALRLSSFAWIENPLQEVVFGG